MRGLLITAVVIVVTLWAMARWLEPRMAFVPSRGVQQTPAAAGLPFTDLKISTADGETLHGWWIEHPTPRAQVIYWHGNGGNLSLWLPVLTDLRRHGFSVLAVDYRGYGASTGTPSERGVYRDAEAVTAYYAQHLRRQSAPTIYWGRSLGCAVASYAARHAPAEGLILESPFPNVRALFSGNPIMLGADLLFVLPLRDCGTPRGLSGATPGDARRRGFDHPVSRRSAGLREGRHAGQILRGAERRGSQRPSHRTPGVLAGNRPFPGCAPGALAATYGILAL